MPVKAEGLRALRRKALLTQKELGDILSVSGAEISRWECGHKRCPIDKLRQLEAFFGRPVLVKGTLVEIRRADPVLISLEERKFLKTAHNMREALGSGWMTIRDLLDALYEFLNIENAIAYLEKWKKIGFYHHAPYERIDEGRFLWRMLPAKYKEAISDEHKRDKKSVYGE